jgi:hypothetical protein
MRNMCVPVYQKYAGKGKRFRQYSKMEENALKEQQQTHIFPRLTLRNICSTIAGEACETLADNK